MCCNPLSLIKSRTVRGSVILALEWRSNKRLDYKEANVLLPRYNFIILAVNGPESEIRFSFSPAGKYTKKALRGSFSIARHWISGNDQATNQNELNKKPEVLSSDKNKHT